MPIDNPIDLNADYIKMSGTSGTAIYIEEIIRPSASSNYGTATPIDHPDNFVSFTLPVQVLAINVPVQVRNLTEEEDRALWNALYNSVTILEKGRLVK